MTTLLRVAATGTVAIVAIGLVIRLNEVLRRLTEDHKALLDIEQAREDERTLAEFHREPYGTFEYLQALGSDEHIGRGREQTKWWKDKPR